VAWQEELSTSNVRTRGGTGAPGGARLRFSGLGSHRSNVSGRGGSSAGGQGGSHGGGGRWAGHGGGGGGSRVKESTAGTNGTGAAYKRGVHGIDVNCMRP
jgi:hypothetical protein